MAIGKLDSLRGRIREMLQSDDFQREASGKSGAALSASIVVAFKRRAIDATLLSVVPADSAALADFGAIWQSAGSEKQTNWFSLRRR